MYLVKGESSGKASSVWGAWASSGTGVNPGGLKKGTTTGNNNNNTIGWGTNVDSSSIYPTFKVEKGKYKVIIETHLYFDNNSYGPNGEKATSAREVFGLRLVNPKSPTVNGATYFPSVIIFTPNNGFSETAPK